LGTRQQRVQLVASVVLPYVVRLSNPPKPHERLQLAASRILPIAIMPATCSTVGEWIERYRRNNPD
jgi:hypothetical protein